MQKKKHGEKRRDLIGKMVKIKIKRGKIYDKKKEFLDKIERLRERRETGRLRSAENKLVYQERTRQPRLTQEVRKARIKERAVYKKERPIERLKQELDTSKLKKAFKSKGSRKEITKRAAAVKGITQARGIVKGQRYSGPGRPRGTYKYAGMPIHIYKAMMRQKQAQYQQYQQDQQMRMRSKGFSPEQVQQLQQQQALQELEMPSQQLSQQESPQQMQQVQQYPQQQAYPQQIQRQPIQIIPQRTSGYQKMKVPTGQRGVQPGPSVADEELNFRKWSAEKTISPNTQRILDTIRRIQNKGKSDNIEQQRRNRERLIVGRSMNPMKAHENMIDARMDFTGIPQDNILLAPSVFQENPENNILRNNRGGFSILNTRDSGNNLKFF
jgi:hypothetical protein